LTVPKYREFSIDEFTKSVQELQRHFVGKPNTPGLRLEISEWLDKTLKTYHNVLYKVEGVCLPVKRFLYVLKTDSPHSDLMFNVNIVFDFDIDIPLLFELNDLESLLTSSIPRVRFLAKQQSEFMI